MKDELSFDTTKISEVLADLDKNYNEYVEAIEQLDSEIEKLELTWGSNEKSIYNDFKEKYNEKKQKLKDLADLTKTIINSLEQKNSQLESATERVRKNFE